MSASSPPPASSSSSDVSPQQIGKAFVVQYYRLLHEHPESLHRFYSSASTLMHDDPTKTVTGTEAIAKRIEQLSFKQRHVKIRQVDCHSTVGSAVVVQVCGEISSTMNDPNAMKRFVQTFVLAPTEQAKQKYYVHNDIFRYQDTPIVAPSTPTEGKSPSTHPNEGFSTLTVPTSKIEFADNSISEKKEEKSPSAAGTHMTPPVTPVDTQEKEATSKPKSYRDAIGKAEKPTAAAAATATATASESQPVAAAATGNTNNNKSKKANKQQQQQQQQQPQQKPTKAAGNPNNRSTRGHPQDVNEYCDDSWYYSTAEEGYLSTGYTDDQEVFVGHLSAQVTENEIRELFRSYGNLLHIRIGNTGSQVGAANFAFVVCQSIEMAQAVVADHEHLMKSQKVEVEAKKRRPFAHTFRPTYPTAASPSSYQSTGYSSAFYNNASYYNNAPPRGAAAAGSGSRRGGRGASAGAAAAAAPSKQ